MENNIRKYGNENFTIVLILECKIDMLNYWEDFYIKYYNTIHPNGMNLMSGGGNGRVHNTETKDKMTLTRIGKTHSEITKQKITKSLTGLTRTDEYKVLIGKTSKYRNMSVKNKELLNNALKIVGIDDLPMYIYFSL